MEKDIQTASFYFLTIAGIDLLMPDLSGLLVYVGTVEEGRNLTVDVGSILSDH